MSRKSNVHLRALGYTLERAFEELSLNLHTQTVLVVAWVWHKPFPHGLISQTRGPMRLLKKNTEIRNTNCCCLAQRFDQNFKKEQSRAGFRLLVSTSEQLQVRLKTYEALKAQPSIWMIIQMEP